jgi:hypothetical protein
MAEGILQRLMTETWPAKLAKSALEALMLPGQVYQGQVSMTGPDGRTNPEAINKAADLAGLVTGGSYAAAPAMKNASGMGIKAYHGSPHDFDKFDLSKIGTGEGAQAYGHGLYFAENEGVAKAYREALSPGYDMRVAGKEYNSSDPAHLAAHHLEMFGKRGNSPQEIAARLREDAHLGKRYSDAAELIESGAKLPEFHRVPSGKMYEVNINAHPDQFLDWDKPIKQQPGVLDKVRQTVMPSLRDTFDNNVESGIAGANAYRNYVGGSDVGASQVLRDYANIPGIKYLDQGSRSAGQGSSNYVVFDDKLIDILKKYGIAGAGPLAALMAQGEEAGVQ